MRAVLFSKLIHRKSFIMSIHRITYILFVLVFGSTQAISQDVLRIRLLNIKDSLPVQNAHIIWENGRHGTKSDENGYFLMELKEGRPLVISHVSFEKKTITMNKKTSDVLFLTPKINQLSEFEVSSLPQRNLMKDKKIYVIDYGFEKDSLILLAYNNRRFKEAHLLLMNTSGDTLESKSLNKMEALYRDCFNNNHLLGKYKASQIFVDSGDIKLLYEVAKDSFLQIFSNILAYHDHKFLLRRNSMANQVVEFFLFNSLDSSMTLLRKIEDEGGLERLSDKSRLQSSQGYSQADARFEEMCFYSPKELPIVAVDDKLLVFNSVENCIEYYNWNAELEQNKEVSFLKDKKWDKKILVDRATQKIYAQFSKNGLSKLRPINMNDGSLGKEIKIPVMSFVQKIQIHNNHLYFLYNDITNFNYKQLYVMAL